MQVNFLTTCDLASITREGKLNIIGIFKQIFVQRLPTNYLKFTIVGILTAKENSQIKLTLRVTSPDKSELMKQQVNIQVGASGSANMFFDVVNLPLGQTGDYSIDLLNEKNQVLGTATLTVLMVKPKDLAGPVN